MPPILFEVKDSIAHITLNRPDKLNVFNREMALLLQQHLDVCNEDENIRCVYLTGAGRAFSAGQDLAEIADSNGPKMNQVLAKHYNPIIIKIHHLKKPVVTAVNGVAAGAGANIALTCDIVVAARSASFIQAFTKIGLIPDSGGTYTLPRLIGWQKASALMLSGDKISADEAERLGMIYKVFDDENFIEESLKIAFNLAAMPSQALHLTKKALRLSATQNFEEQLISEDKLQQLAASTEDFKEGIRAFIEKRQPRFTGR
ncbi:MAG: enoyl-CoA hydratase-related protein [Ilyomonas sp.]